jgi:hypothetical protein
MICTQLTKELQSFCMSDADRPSITVRSRAPQIAELPAREALLMRNAARSSFSSVNNDVTVVT